VEKLTSEWVQSPFLMVIKMIKNNSIWKPEYLKRDISTRNKQAEFYKQLVANGVPYYQAYLISRKVKA